VYLPVELRVPDPRVGTKGRQRGLGPAGNNQSFGVKLGQPRNYLGIERALDLRRVRIAQLGVADDDAPTTGRGRAGARVERKQGTDGKA
jgi:hypothetical protein